MENITIESEVFETLRLNANAVLQRLMKDMIEKNSEEGKITITIDIAMTPHEGEADEPVIKHKVASALAIKNNLDGVRNNEGMKVAYDDVTKQWVLKPMTGGEQMNIFDAEFYAAEDEEVEYEPALDTTPRLEMNVPEIEEIEDISDEF